MITAISRRISTRLLLLALGYHFFEISYISLQKPEISQDSHKLSNQLLYDFGIIMSTNNCYMIMLFSLSVQGFSKPIQCKKSCPTLLRVCINRQLTKSPADGYNLSIFKATQRDRQGRMLCHRGFLFLFALPFW